MITGRKLTSGPGGAYMDGSMWVETHTSKSGYRSAVTYTTDCFVVLLKSSVSLSVALLK